MSKRLQARTKAFPTAEARNKGKLKQDLFGFFGWDRIYQSLQKFKLQRSWSNLRLDRQRLIDFGMASADWYTLHIPAAELQVRSFGDIRKLDLSHPKLRLYKEVKTLESTLVRQAKPG